MWRCGLNVGKSQAALQFEQEFCSQRDGSLCPYTVYHHMWRQAITQATTSCFPHTLRCVSNSALCCINYTSSASNRACFFFIFVILQWDLASNYYSHLQADCFQRMLVLCLTWRDLLRPAPCQHLSVGELFSKEHCAVFLVNFGDIFFQKSKVSLAKRKLLRKPVSSYMNCLSCIIF